MVPLDTFRKSIGWLADGKTDAELDVMRADLHHFCRVLYLWWERNHAVQKPDSPELELGGTL
jgi:hypothetical protein